MEAVVAYSIFLSVSFTAEAEVNKGNLREKSGVHAEIRSKELPNEYHICAFV
jgi:hypothetical protein